MKCGMKYYWQEFSGNEAMDCPIDFVFVIPQGLDEQRWIESC
jgi:hypothetical protein